MDKVSQPIIKRVPGGEYSSIIIEPRDPRFSYVVETIYFGDDGSTVGPVRSTLSLHTVINGNIQELEIRRKEDEK